MFIQVCSHARGPNRRRWRQCVRQAVVVVVVCHSGSGRSTLAMQQPTTTTTTMMIPHGKLRALQMTHAHAQCRLARATTDSTMKMRQGALRPTDRPTPLHANGRRRRRLQWVGAICERVRRMCAYVYVCVVECLHALEWSPHTHTQAQTGRKTDDDDDALTRAVDRECALAHQMKTPSLYVWVCMCVCVGGVFYPHTYNQYARSLVCLFVCVYVLCILFTRETNTQNNASATLNSRVIGEAVVTAVTTG